MSVDLFKLQESDSISDSRKPHFNTSICTSSPMPGSLPIDDALAAAIEIVELRLGHAVVYVHRGYRQFTRLRQLIQSVYTRYALLDDS